MRTIVTRLALIAGVALTGAANADTPWGNGMASGTNVPGTFFDWSGGHNSNTNLYGTPTLVGSAFYFFPSEFVAQSDLSNGYGTHVATDTLEVDLFAHVGFAIEGISVAEYGDFTIAGPNASADLTGVMQISDGVHGSLAPNNLGFNPVFPATSGSNTTWGGSAITDLTTFGAPFTGLHLSITNNLIAISVPGSSAVIRKTIVGGAMAINVLPEPGALALIVMAGLVVARRRRS